MLAGYKLISKNCVQRIKWDEVLVIKKKDIIIFGSLRLSGNIWLGQ